MRNIATCESHLHPDEASAHARGLVEIRHNPQIGIRQLFGKALQQSDYRYWIIPQWFWDLLLHLTLLMLCLENR